MLIYLKRLSAKHFLFPFPLSPKKQKKKKHTQLVAILLGWMHLHGFANMAHVHFKWREVKCYCFWFHYKSLFSGRVWLLLLPLLWLLLSRLFARLAYFFLLLTCIAPCIWISLLICCCLSSCLNRIPLICSFETIFFFCSIRCSFFQSSFVRFDNV